MVDPTWATRTPELNDTLLKGGSGVLSTVANGAAWASVAAAHHSTAIASTVNTAATSATWLGMSSASSAVQATTLNTELHGLAGWVDVKPAIASAAVAAYQLAYSTMRTAEECMANRTEWGNDNAINPLVLFSLTPRIASLDLTYFGGYWPNNAAAGATMGATLTALAASLAIPPPIASLGASPDAPVAAGEAVTEAGAQAASSAAMKSSYEGATAAGCPPEQEIVFSPPTAGAAGVLDVSPCSPYRATPFADLLRVLHAAAMARIAATCTPAAWSTRTDSRAVAPVVTTSSTSNTSVPGRGPRSRTRPLMLRSRAEMSRPTESRAIARMRKAAVTVTSGCAATAVCAIRVIGSPPRRRAAVRRVGAGTIVSGVLTMPQQDNRWMPTASVCARGATRSPRPRSLSARMAWRRTPV